MLSNPGARALIVRKTQKSMTNTTLITFDQHVLPEALTSGLVSWYGGSQREAAQYRYTNGSSINVGGMDNPDKIMSSEYDIIYVQEATELTVGDWEALNSRLRNGRVTFQQLLADCNPAQPTHFLKQRADTGTIKMLTSRHEDNPRLYDKIDVTALDSPVREFMFSPTPAGVAYLKRLDALTGVRLQRLRYGRWVAAEGAIYDEYDSDVHLLDRFEIPVEWPRYWSIDWGFTNPFVCQRWAEDPDGRLYLYAETYRTQRTVDQHATEILSEVTDGQGNWVEPKPQFITADHDAGDRVMFTKMTGLPTRAAKKDVLNGIQAVQRRFRVAKDGRPRIFFLRNAVRNVDTDLVEAGKSACTVDEIPGYVWKDGAKEEPVKPSDDHGEDAKRYLVAELDLRGETRMRWLG